MTPESRQPRRPLYRLATAIDTVDATLKAWLRIAVWVPLIALTAVFSFLAFAAFVASSLVDPFRAKRNASSRRPR